MSDDDEFERPGRELDDREYPDPDDADDESDTAPCPECGAQVYEDAVQCPRCGAYVTPGSGASSGWPAWWIILGVLGAAAAIFVLALAPPW